MRQAITLTLAASALALAACASRPPDQTAGTPAPAAAPAAAASGAGQRGAAAPATPAGSAVATAPSAPGERSVYFEFDSSTLSPQAQGVIQQNARYAQPRSTHVRLEGNADERGSREYNLALGQRRAEAVRQAMVLDGVRADALEAVSNGEERPRCSERTEDCYATNRRVDIMVAP